MKNCKVGILYNRPLDSGTDFSEASVDVMTQVDAVEHALAKLGYPSARIPFTKDAVAVSSEIGEERADIYVNLCESVDEDPLLIGHPAAVLELLGLPFTGSSSLALMLTTDKVMSKRVLAGGGIRTPAYAFFDGRERPNLAPLRFPVIVKPRFQDASIGIEQDSVFQDEARLREQIDILYQRYGPLLIEEYISGREFNISLLGYPDPSGLPIAEIDFAEYPPGLHRIVGYRAKWDSSSFEYHHSPRVFPQLPPPLNEHLKEVALACFHLFMLRDYARVDVRVDDRGEVYVLEINANPCISPDAGFPAAAYRHGLTYTDLIQRLLRFAEQRKTYGFDTPART